MIRRTSAVMWTAAAAVALTTITGVSQAASGATAASASTSVVPTDRGAVQGRSVNGVDSFLGIRYAKAPTGSLRWMPPQPPNAWGGVRQATSFGSACPQVANTNSPLTLDEDCLFLNVWRPAGATATSHLPVLVFIHGGGLSTGSGSQHDGTSFVTQTGIVVVSINYRLGVLGFLGLPALTAQQGESGNYGLLDEIAALKWVNRNIRAFGGDPARVTIGGESAGANSVCALLSSPRAVGLFAGAIMQSGTCRYTTTEADAEFWGQYTARNAGCPVPAQYLSCLRRLDAQTLLTTWGDQGNESVIVGGTPTVPVQPQLAIQQGSIAKVPVLVGSNRDEGRTLVADDPSLLTKAEYEDWISNSIYTASLSAIESAYPWPANPDQFTSRYLTGAIISDNDFGIGGCPQRHLTDALAHATTTFEYEFDNRTGPGLRPDPVGFEWGAGHAAELAYMWPSFYNSVPINPDRFSTGDKVLSTQMINYWGAFVRNGRPAFSGQHAWPSFNASHSVMSLRAGTSSTLISTGAFSAEHKCSFWG